MRILVAIPIYDGRIHAEIVNCLMREQREAFRSGDEIELCISHGSAGIAQARNLLATQFLDGNYDRLLFLDNDVTWETGDLLKLCKMPVEFVGGCYPLKRVGERYPIAFLPNTPPFQGIDLGNNTALIEVEGLPTGFLALSRSVFEKMLKASPDRGLTEQLGQKCYCFFEMPYVDGHLYGEDLYFCRKWIEMGEKIYLYPELSLTHWDFRPTPHQGHIGNWLKNRDKPQLDLNAEINKLAANIENFKNSKGMKNGKDAIPGPTIPQAPQGISTNP